MLDVESHALVAQSPDPAAQQGCGLQVHREHAAGRADEGVDAESARPLAQRRGVEVPQPPGDGRGPFPEARREDVRRVGMREVQSPLAGDEELAADGPLGLVHVDFPAGGARGFGGHQAGRTAADDGEAGQGKGSHAAFWHRGGGPGSRREPRRSMFHGFSRGRHGPGKGFKLSENPLNEAIWRVSVDKMPLHTNAARRRIRT